MTNSPIILQCKDKITVKNVISSNLPVKDIAIIIVNFLIPIRKIILIQLHPKTIPDLTKCKKIIDIYNEEEKYFFDTRRDLGLMSYKCYVTIGSQKLSFDAASYYDVGKEIVYPIGYYSYESCANNFLICTIFYALQSL